jgi:hypothetical protein
LIVKARLSLDSHGRSETLIVIGEASSLGIMACTVHHAAELFIVDLKMQFEFQKDLIELEH